MDKVKYINSQGEEIALDALPYIMTTSDLRDYAWSYSTKNDYNPQIFSFNRSMVKKSVSIAVVADTKEHYNRYCNKLLEVFEKDIYSLKQGRIVFNDDYYMECYVIARKVGTWFPGNNAIVNEFTIVSETGRWYKDVVKTFGSSYVSGGGSADVTTPKNYPNDYPYDYAPSSDVNRLVSDSFVPFDFEIVFHGACDNPTVIAGNHVYRVYTTLEDGEYLTVNSVQKTIKKTKVNGEEVNEFYLRDRDNYIFEKMKATDGKTLVETQDNCVVSIRAFTERSEPKWI